MCPEYLVRSLTGTVLVGGGGGGGGGGQSGCGWGVELRKTDDENGLNTTPGFRKHVHKAYRSEIIDRYRCGMGGGVRVGWMVWMGCRVEEDR